MSIETRERGAPHLAQLSQSAGRAEEAHQRRSGKNRSHLKRRRSEEEEEEEEGGRRKRGGEEEEGGGRRRGGE